MIRKIYTLLLVVSLCATTALAQTPSGTYNGDKLPSLSAIDQELSDLLTKCRSYDNLELYSKHSRFKELMETYLCHPETLSKGLPKLEEMIYTYKSQDGKVKFYGCWLEGGGTESLGINFIQYVNAIGKVVCMPYNNDLRYSRQIVNVWEFTVCNQQYFALMTFWRGMLSFWEYNLEILSLKNGVYYTQTDFFFPEGVGQVYEEEYFTYDSEGRIDDIKTRPTSYVEVCNSGDGNGKVDFNFDPKTLTVTVWNPDYNSDNPREEVVETKWQLIGNSYGLLESIQGDWDGDGKMDMGNVYYRNTKTRSLVDDDEIYTGPEDQYWIDFYNNIVSIDDNMVSGCIACPTNEGDLDGDGGDELGFWSRAGMTACGSYNVYTYKSGEWKKLLSISHNPNWNDCDYQDLVRKHPTNPNWLIVKEIILDSGKIRDRVIDIDKCLSTTFRYERLNFVDNYVYIDGWVTLTDFKSEYDLSYIKWHDVILRISHCDCEPFTFYGGCTYQGERYADDYVQYPYDHDESFVTAPDDLFFFADLDFDGTKELITGLIPYAGSQRYCAAFMSIYRLVDGRYIDATQEFHALSEVFKMIDPTGWSIDSETREIYHYNIAGNYHNVRVYKFEQGRYYFARSVDCNFSDLGQNGHAKITVNDNNNKEILNIVVSKSDYEQNWWDYVRYAHLQNR